MKRNKIYELLLDKNNNFFIQLFRYAVVGGIATVVDFGLLFVFTEFIHLHYLISAIIGFIGGLLTNYILSTLWVFESKGKFSRKTEIILFSLIGVIGLGLNELIMYVFVELVGVLYLIAKLVSTVLVLFWNFLARKYFVF